MGSRLKLHSTYLWWSTCSQGSSIYLLFTSFYRFAGMHKFYEKKSWNVCTEKLFLKTIQCIFGFFHVFLFQPLFKGKYLSICTKLCKYSKLTRRYVFANRTVNSTNQQFYKNWWVICKCWNFVITTKNIYKHNFNPPPYWFI